MQVSFDVDDTLVCAAHVPTEQSLPRWRRWWYPERLRLGTKPLMEELVRRRCRLWIYTTSYRSPRYLHGWFRALALPLAGVVNQDRHEQVVGRQGPSKNPAVFGIDLHVDDSEGVELEGKRHGFAVVVVAPEDPNWGQRVLEAVDRRMSLGARSGSDGHSSTYPMAQSSTELSPPDITSAPWLPRDEDGCDRQGNSRWPG